MTPAISSIAMIDSAAPLPPRAMARPTATPLMRIRAPPDADSGRVPGRATYDTGAALSFEQPIKDIAVKVDSAERGCASWLCARGCSGAAPPRMRAEKGASVCVKSAARAFPGRTCVFRGTCAPGNEAPRWDPCSGGRISEAAAPRASRQGARLPSPFGLERGVGVAPCVRDSRVVHGRAVRDAGGVEGACEELVQFGSGYVEVGRLHRSLEGGAQDSDRLTRPTLCKEQPPELKVGAGVARDG